MTLRPFSVVVGFFTVSVVFNILKFGLVVLIWLAHVPAKGLLAWALSMLILVVAQASGGYAAAALARSRGLAAATAVGVVDLLLVGISILLDHSGWWASWMSMLYLALIVPSAAAGGWYALRRREDANPGTEDSDDLDLGGV